MLLLISKTSTRLGLSLSPFKSNYLGVSRLGSFSKLNNQIGQDKQLSRVVKKYEKPEKGKIKYVGLGGKRALPTDNFEISYRQAIKSKKDFGNRQPTLVYFQVIGNGGPGVGQSLYLYTDHNRYLFNCSESTHRLSIDNCQFNALDRLENIFITSRTWKNLGGLPGLCLCLRSSGAPDVSIHGPTNSLEILEAMKGFIILNNFDVNGFTEDHHVFEDNTVTIRHVKLESSHDPVFPPEPLYTSWVPDSYVYKPSINLSNPRRNAIDWARNPIDQSIKAYIVTVKAAPAEFSMEKCIELGIPPGLLIRELRAGREVVLDDGTLITPDQVRSEAIYQGQTYIIIECPSRDYLPSLLSEKLLASEHKELKNICGIFHFTPHEVIESEEYSSWVNSFPAKTRNVIINQNSVGYGARDYLIYNQKLRAICPQIFPNLLKVQKDDLSTRKCNSTLTGIVKQAQSGLRLLARPPSVEVVGLVENVSESEIQYEMHSLEGVKESIARVHEQVRILEEDSKAKSLPQFPIVTFLGTGSTTPSKYRNVSGILLETHPDNFILLDCGEGTLLQIYRQFGQKRSLEILRNLKAVYVSHLHADHHSGLIGIVLERAKAFKSVSKNVEKMFVIAPSLISQYLSLYHHKFEPVLTDLYQIQSQHLLYYGPKSKKILKLDSFLVDVLKEMLVGTGLKSIRTSPAHHCPDSFCVSLITKDDYKIVYTGDTRPNPALHDLGTSKGKFPDLLIHEATMEHHMLKSCIAKKHSTFTEAAQEGLNMNAKYTVLTHFSQRYSKMPVLDELETPGMDTIGVAFDGMTLNPSTLGHIRTMFPALKVMFPEEVRCMDDRKANFEVHKNAPQFVLSNLMNKQN